VPLRLASTMATAPAFPEPRDALDALTELVLEVSVQRKSGGALQVALRQCLTLTGSQFGFVGLVREGESAPVLEIVAIHGFHPAATFYAEYREIPLRPNIFNRVVLEDRPVRTADAANDPSRVGQPRGHPSVGAFLGVPLRLDGRPIGMIGLANRPGPYGDDHERLALTYASLIAVLVHNAELYEQLQQTNSWLERLVDERTRELAQARDALAEKAARLQAVLSETVDAQERERQRIAEDIHDGINQLLIGAMLELSAGRERIDAGQPEAATPALESARDILARVESEIRRVVHDLHPPVLEGLGLPAAIRDVADRFQQFTHVKCAVEVRGRSCRLPARTEISLYRIVQEALQNVAVHAGAGRVDVRLTFDAPGGGVEVLVRDDGRGFDPAGLPWAPAAAAGRPGGPGRGGRASVAEPGTRHHLGLESMRRRVESLAGEWDLCSGPGSGTTIRARVPLR
jgi:signal transduction histidine kinase